MIVSTSSFSRSRFSIRLVVYGPMGMGTGAVYQPRLAVYDFRTRTWRDARAMSSRASSARRSLVRRVPRGDRSVWAGVGAAVLLVPSAGLGLAWTSGLVSFDRPWSYSALNIHVFAGLAY